MTTLCYLAILEPSTDGWGVWFPDVPGCTSAGDSLMEAGRNAREALQAHLLLLAESGDPLPQPSDQPQWPTKGGTKAVLVAVDLPGRQERINMTIDRALLAVADRAAQTLGMTRSGYLAHLVRRAAKPAPGSAPRRKRR